MDEANVNLILDASPDAATIRHLRDQAQDNGASAIATFDVPGEGTYYLVVSERGTCVLLKDGVSVQTFNPSFDDEHVAETLLADA
jgi:hypothetical protein